MTSKLKFAGFQVGQRIRAYDFKQRPDIGDRYIEGEILAVNEQGNTEASWAHYVVRVDVDTAFAVGQDRVGMLTYVPMETTFDWDRRVVPAATKSKRWTVDQVYDLSGNQTANLLNQLDNTRDKLFAALILASDELDALCQMLPDGAAFRVANDALVAVRAAIAKAEGK